MADAEEKPVLSGLVALVAVALVVGLLAGFGALIGTRVLGLGGGGGDTGGGDPAAGESLYLPDPVPTEAEDGPLVSLVPSLDEDPDEEPPPSEAPTSEKPEREITLSAGADQVAAGGQLYLTGVYPGGEGTVLDIESRQAGGQWEEFPLDVNVSNETFTTYVETFRSGRIEWRMRDADRRLTSNVVAVQHG